MRHRRVGAALLAWVALAAGCGREEVADAGKPQDKQAAAPPGVVVLGPSKVDKGRIKRSMENVSHTYDIRNDSNRTANVQEVRTSCSCAGSRLASRTLAPGDETTLTVDMEIASFWGKRETLAVVIFEDPCLTPLTLHLSAFVEKDYRVDMVPMQWPVPPDAEVRQPLRRTFRVREYVSSDMQPEARTRVESLDDDLAIVTVAPWKTVGPAIHGFCRETELVLEYRPPGTGNVDDALLGLKFEHTPGGEVRPASAWETRVNVLVRRF